jgi:nitroreductase
MSGLFNEPVNEIIRRRCSWRSYTGEPVDRDTLRKLEVFIEGLSSPPSDSKTRFKIITSPDKKEGVKGTYGVVRGASTFIAGAVKDNPRAMEDFGYQFEKIILFATSLNLGTCWLGGSFKRTVFAEKIGLEESEIIPAVTPIGYTAGRRTIIDNAFRFIAGSKKRKAFSELFFIKSFDTPLTGSDASKYAVPLEMVRLGPSASNKQPWRMIIDGDSVHLILQRTDNYAKMLPIDIQKIDMGIAMCHFELSAKGSGIGGRWVDANPGIMLPELSEYSSTWIVES